MDFSFFAIWIAFPQTVCNQLQMQSKSVDQSSMNKTEPPSDCDNFENVKIKYVRIDIRIN